MRIAKNKEALTNWRMRDLRIHTLLMIWLGYMIGWLIHG